jgi:glycosyltransferase involved in cell wall biosynthesis
VVYEYANRLVARGHEVTVVHPRRLKSDSPAGSATAYRFLRGAATRAVNLLSRPTVDWQPIDSRVRMAFVSSSDFRNIPDGDALFATSWNTVHSVLESPDTKGNKFNLIQGYGAWLGPREQVDATWRAPLHHVVISKWLLDVGKELGCSAVYIPNAIDHARYKVTQPIAGRGRQVAMLFSTTPIKGSADGVEALRIARETYPDLRAVFFGVSRGQSWIPSWATYYRNPPQDFIVNEIYNRSSIFLSPSWSEGFALPPAEAAACGCAVVGADSGGIRDIVQNGVTGLLSAPQDPKSLAENLGLMLRNDDQRVQFAKAGKSFVDRFSWDRSTDLLERFITDVTQNQKSVPQGVLS